ncbi:F-box domain containing protein [Parasponia andersonii]|uniref:F-box domain containing protein n=1 Tax=Parasponia andersonii TaxID=3476 RepID=A0A2P5DED7_PARAD|nr:F-box domain containing protein [Parasponia andersonii]
MASSPKVGPNSLELPREVTASILSRYVAIEILTSLQMVCKSRMAICEENPFMWRTIDDMRNVTVYEMNNLELLRMCRVAVDRSRGELVDIKLEYFVDDELLKYITDSQVSCCVLNSCETLAVTLDIGLSEAIAKLPLLEELDLTLCSFSESTLEALGSSCPRLISLKLNRIARVFKNIDPYKEMKLNEIAIAIGKNLSGLCHLQLMGDSMINMGLEAILDGCPNLETLDLHRCLNIDLSENLGERCAQQIKHLRPPHDPVEDDEFVVGYE